MNTQSSNGEQTQRAILKTISLISVLMIAGCSAEGTQVESDSLGNSMTQNRAKPSEAVFQMTTIEEGGSPDEEPSTPMPREVDWAAAEDIWFDRALAGMKEIAKRHPDVEFYGVFIDCNSYYLSMMAHLNTESGLRESAEKLKEKFPKYSDQSIQQVMETLRWSGGDFSYFEEYALPSDPEVGALHKQMIAMRDSPTDEGDNATPLGNSYMEMCCRVVVRLEQSGVFDQLRKAPGFRVVCVEEDESFEDGEARLNRIRKTFGGS